MHYHAIKPDKHLIVFIMHTMQLLQISVIRTTTFLGKRVYLRAITRLNGQALSPPVFFSSPELSSDDASVARQVLVHVLAHVTHRQLNITKVSFVLTSVNHVIHETPNPDAI